MAATTLFPVRKNYIEGMKHLIEFYYLLKTIPKKQWFSDKDIKMIAKVFTLTISNFTKSIMYWDGFDYHLRYGSKKTEIIINEKDFEKFLKIFDDFYKEIMNGTLEEAYKVTKSTISIDVVPIESNQLKKLGHELYFRMKKINKSFSCKIYKEKEPWIKNGRTDRVIQKRIESDLGQLPIYHEIFYADFNFDSHLVYSLSAQGPNGIVDLPGGLEVIESPRPSQKTDFCDVIRYVIAKYYLLFGSFKRIKICLNDDCKKIFVEKKLGAKCFCDKHCRMEYNANHQPRKIRLCRERQNYWFSNQAVREDIKFNDDVPDSIRIHKSDCDSCCKPVKSGHCPFLKIKNPQRMEIIRKAPKRAKVPSKLD